MKIQENISLLPYNTFGMEVTARYFVQATSQDDIVEAIKFSKEVKLPILVLSGGSNMLLMEDLQAVVLHMDTKGIEIVSDQLQCRQTDNASQGVLVKVEAGEDWPQFVQWAVEQDLCGVENLSLIPGRVGSSPVQNIGAYGVEAKDSIYEVNAIEIATLKYRTFSNQECEFGYRESVFKGSLKGQYIITCVVFSLSKPQAYTLKLNYGNINTELDSRGISSPTIAHVCRVVSDIRREKLPDPAKVGNCGSFFKNPVLPRKVFEELKEKYPEMPSFDVENASQEYYKKVPAAWLIDRAGWKGIRRADAGVHPNQALVLVNYKNATAAQIYGLCQDICSDVLLKFGVEIHPEVNMIDNKSLSLGLK